MIIDFATAVTAFPDGDWADKFRNQENYQPPIELFDRAELSLAPPPGPECFTNECEWLRSIKPLRPNRLKQICQQAQSEKHAIQPVLDVLSIHIDQPPNGAAAAFRQLILDNLWGPIFMFKTKFNRPRPWNCCSSELEPLFQRPDRLYPGHPSYPSGHATMAYAWAYLLSHVQPLHSARLVAAANEVAFHREVAGVHFQSDSEAGKNLGQQIADLILRSPQFDVTQFSAAMSG